jgi:LmbE family N-acetylglucosaminyl deacetylase
MDGNPVPPPPEPTPAYKPKYSSYYISPHPDDIAFSCFGPITNPPFHDSLIVTVFDQSTFSFLPAPQSPNASEATQAIIAQIRKSEDSAFAKLAGCDLVSLDLRDSSVRYDEPGVEYATSPRQDAVYETVVEKLTPFISDVIAAGAAIYVPLGLAHHVDHSAVRDAVPEIISSTIAEQSRNRRKATTTIFFYEDLPYASSWGSCQIRRYAEGIVGPSAAPLLVDLSSTWNKKLDAIRTYASQLEPETIPTIYNYARRIATGESLSERLWCLPTEAAGAASSHRIVDTVAWVSWEACRLWVAAVSPSRPS